MQATDQLRQHAYKGLVYEKLVCDTFAKMLPDWQITPGIWFDYGTMDGGEHICEIDLVMQHKDICIIVEIKKTQTVRALDELRGLYLHIARLEWGRTHKVFGMQVFGSASGAFNRGFKFKRFVTQAGLGRIKPDEIPQWHLPSRELVKFGEIPQDVLARKRF